MTRLSAKTVLAIACMATMMMSVAGCHSGSSTPPTTASTAAPAPEANDPGAAGRAKDAEMRAQAMAAAHKP